MLAVPKPNIPGRNARTICYICQSPAYCPCERCHSHICISHTKTHVQMHWEHFFAGGSRGGGYWTRYLPNGLLLKVCPACDADLTAKDRVELECDRALIREKFMMYAVTIAIIVAPLLLGRFFCR